ncbi:hypothetical protein K450DRAFT_274063 [Umbelopsis ramanniana AG]|uniref:Uncharacterized protein n=1 Tax=Umbelopsis ramanniana AG TaxID=1314678 RepID=A0AAD5E5L6_UMBRA|nr:uncharacterized protein K450DRAFT_274063 [Umbelopsis ramanniana AG]KAI8577194.1 hypothetical protein K450DRAFT_274063 [Umbelopsis ramanniana AG]
MHSHAPRFGESNEFKSWISSCTSSRVSITNLCYQFSKLFLASNSVTVSQVSQSPPKSPKSQVPPKHPGLYKEDGRISSQATIPVRSSNPPG